MTLCLILHKVRGEAAFDVAEADERGWWIIGTSGHRAYPIMAWPLLDTCKKDVEKSLFHAEHLPGWHSLRDHYSAMEVLPQENPEKAARLTFTADDL